MNADTLKGRWLQLRGHVKRQWGKLTDDELDEIDGDLDVLVGKLRQHYGERREAIEKRLESWTKDPA